MNIIFLIPFYQRPSIAQASINTLINNTNITPNEVYFIDDGSDPAMRRALLEISINSSKFPIHFHSHGKNCGIGHTFEEIFDIIRRKEPDIAVICESDYIWRKEWLEDCLAVFEASPNTVAIPGVHHPDMYDRNKTHGEFVGIMKGYFSQDISNREHLYKPFNLETSRGSITVQGVSNSCGAQILHYGRVREFFFNQLKKEDFFWHWIGKACFKDKPEMRHSASDGAMTSTISWLWDRWAREVAQLDLSKNFGWLDIADFSISSHKCGNGRNGVLPGIKEGDTFLDTDKWKDEYIHNFTRNKL